MRRRYSGKKNRSSLSKRREAILASVVVIALLAAGIFMGMGIDNLVGGTVQAQELSTESAAASSAPAEDESTELSVEVSIAEEEDNAIRLSWSDVDAEAYLVSRAAEGEESAEVVAELSADMAPEFVDVPAEDNFAFVYTVSAVDPGDPDAVDMSRTVEVRKGFIVEDGVLHYYENNEPVKNQVINELKFDSEGNYTSGDTELDSIVTAFIREKTNDSMTQLERFETLYDYVVSDFSYESERYPDTSSPDWVNDYAKSFFTDGNGSCFSYASAVAVLARAVGLEADAVIGSCHQTYQWVEHGWTEVVYGGETLLCDAEMEGIFAPNRDWDWDLFMKPYGETPTSYEKY